MKRKEWPRTIATNEMAKTKRGGRKLRRSAEGQSKKKECVFSCAMREQPTGTTSEFTQLLIFVMANIDGKKKKAFFGAG